MTLKKTLTVSLVCILLSGVALAKSVGNSRYASLVVDAKNGMILTQANAGEYRYPASLTKMMTLYLAFSALEQGTLKENQLLPVSARAAGQPRTKIGLRAGDKITAKDAIVSLVTISANDAAVVLAESMGGTESAFAQRMTQTAAKLGMGHSRFMNASGLHHPQQRTTAYDMARLAIALRRDFPEYYPLFSRESFIYKGQTFYSHNHVNRKYQGADGIKTGFIGPSGFNLVTSVVRNGKSLVGVVFGGQTFKRRDDHMMSLLDQSFYRLAQGVPKSEMVAIKMPAIIGSTAPKSQLASSDKEESAIALPLQEPAKPATPMADSSTADALQPYIANVPPPVPAVAPAPEVVSSVPAPVSVPDKQVEVANTPKPIVADFSVAALDPTTQIQSEDVPAFAPPIKPKAAMKTQTKKTASVKRTLKAKHKRAPAKKVTKKPASNATKQAVSNAPVPVLKP